MKYLVAMSGGIDSSVSAVMLKKEGHEVIGAHMLLWAEDMDRNKCCNPTDKLFAQRVAEKYDIPFKIFDFSQEFKKQMVEDCFLKAHQCGRTPNVCVSCNRIIRFGLLLDKAVELGMDKVVTGHYARITEDSGTFKLRSGIDDSKDQSYFLHRLTQDQLARIHFPLGTMRKSEVKDLAKEWGLINSNRAKFESQDLCFIPEKTPEPFLKRHLDKKYWKSGNIVTTDGQEVGKHRGLPFYTIGQRKGLDIGGLEEPLYVIDKNEQANELIVGTMEQGTADLIKVRNLNLIEGNIDQAKKYGFKIRYAGTPHPGRIKLIGKSYHDEVGELHDAEVKLDQKIEGITPGQFVVIYDGDYCLGGGEIR